MTSIFTKKTDTKNNIKNRREEYINYIRGIIKNALSNVELNEIVKTNIFKNNNMPYEILKSILNSNIFQIILTKFVKEKLAIIGESKVMENDIYSKIREIDGNNQNEKINIAEKRIKILLNSEIQKKFINEYTITINNPKKIFNILNENPYFWSNKKIILNKNLDLNKRNKDNKTLLMYAIDNSHTEIARLLIEKRCELNLQDTYGKTALMYAIYRNNIDIAELLIINECNLNLTTVTLDTALMIDISFNTTKNNTIAKLLIEKGYVLNKQNLNKQNLNKQNLNKQNLSGYTALIIAVDKNKTEIAKLLIEKGCDLNLKNVYDNTALMTAIGNNNIELAKLLIEKGCKLDKNVLKAFKEEISSNLNSHSNLKLNNIKNINNLYSFIKYKLNNKIK